MNREAGRQRRLRRSEHGARNWLDLLCLRLSDSRRIDGLWVGVFGADSDKQLILILQRLEEALSLIKRYDRIQHQHIVRDLERIWVLSIPEARASYNHALRICKLDLGFVIHETASSDWIASCIVHEATHARLSRYGFGYEQELRARVEAICIRRQIAFAAKLPDGRLIRQDAEQLLEWVADPEILTDEARGKRLIQANLEYFRREGVPEFALRLLGAAARMLAVAGRLVRRPR